MVSDTLGFMKGIFSFPFQNVLSGGQEEEVQRNAFSRELRFKSVKPALINI